MKTIEERAREIELEAVDFYTKHKDYDETLSKYLSLVQTAAGWGALKAFKQSEARIKELEARLAQLSQDNSLLMGIWAESETTGAMFNMSDALTRTLQQHKTEETK